MKFTVIFATLLSVSWALRVKPEDPKDKRESGGNAYQSSGSLHSFQGPSYGHDEGASAVSIGAGYSVGGAQPSYDFGGHEGGGQFQFSSEELPSNGHATIKLAPITLQPSQGLLSNDLHQLMSQLSHGLNTGSLNLSPYQANGGHGGQQLDLSQFTYGEPSNGAQQYSVQEQSVPSLPAYAAGTKGLGSYSSTGPVLFNPAESSQAGGHGAISLGGNSGHPGGALKLGGSGHSFGAISLGGSGHAFGSPGLSFGSPGHSLGGAGHSLGGLGHSLGGGHSGGHSFGGSLKSYGGGIALPSKTSFKPSTYLGSHSDAGHGLSSLSSSYDGPSFGGHSFSGGHGGFSLGSGGHGGGFGGSFGGFGGGSSKFIAPSYLPPKSEGFGSSLESAASFSSGGHSSSPSGNYGGFSSHSSGGATASHAASSPQYYVKYASPSSFGEGSSSYKAPVARHAALSSHSSRPKYSFSQGSARYASPAHSSDAHGAHSETIYNTIKYSEELKPRTH